MTETWQDVYKKPEPAPPKGTWSRYDPRFRCEAEPTPRDWWPDARLLEAEEEERPKPSIEQLLEDLMWDRRQLQEIAELIPMLVPSDQLLLRMHLAGRPQREMAAAIGLSQPSAHYRLSTTLAWLRTVVTVRVQYEDCRDFSLSGFRHPLSRLPIDLQGHLWRERIWGHSSGTDCARNAPPALRRKISQVTASHRLTPSFWISTLPPGPYLDLALAVSDLGQRWTCPRRSVKGDSSTLAAE